MPAVRASGEQESNMRELLLRLYRTGEMVSLKLQKRLAASVLVRAKRLGARASQGCESMENRSLT